MKPIETRAPKFKDGRSLLRLALYVSFFLAYIRGFLTFPLFALMILPIRQGIRIQRSDVIASAVIAIYFAARLPTIDWVADLQVLRVYFGFFFFYLFFKISTDSTDINFNTLVFLLAAAIGLEALLINTVVSPSDLTVFPNFKTATARTTIFGFYQRPHGIGSNASVTSGVLVIMLILAHLQSNLFRFRRLTGIAAVVGVALLSSGAGLVFLVAALLYFMNRPSRLAFFGILTVAYLATFFVFGHDPFLNYPFLEKISPANLSYLLSLKGAEVGSLYEALSQDPRQWLTGLSHSLQKAHGAYGGDFGFVDQLAALGLGGTALYFAIVVPKVNRRNLFPVALMIFASVHYAMMISVPGQILFGYCLAKFAKDPAPKGI